MAPVLFVVESPGKVKKIQAYLGSGYIVVATKGHILDIGRKGYGFDRAALEGDFEPDYGPTNRKAIAELRRCAKRCDGVLIGTDADRTGAAIGFHVLQVLGLGWRTAKRAVFTEITEAALLRAVERPVPLDEGLYRAEQARRLIDRAVGYLASPAVRRHVQGGVSAGRCQSVAAALVVDRDAAVRRAEQGAEAEFGLRIRLGGPFADLGCARCSCADASALTDEVAAAAAVRAWAAAAYVADADASRTEAARHPPPAYTTSKLQQDAGARLGLNPRAAMALLQKLYQAGHVTYPRTDSTALAPAFVHAAAEVVAAAPWGGAAMVHKRLYGPKGKGRGEGRAATKKRPGGPQEAHEAIRPTRPEVETVAGPGARLYDLIRRRALATQCRPARTQTVALVLRAEDRGTRRVIGTARVVAKRVVDPGFLRVANATVDLGAEPGTLNLLGAVGAGSAALGPHVRAVVAAQAVRRPPKGRFSQASLVAELERVGVGRPSTFSTIVQTVVDRGYAEVASGDGAPVPLVSLELACGSGAAIVRTVEESVVGAFRRKLVPTASGRAVTAYLRERFPEVADARFTADVEARLDAIAAHDAPWRDAVRQIWAAMEPRAEAEKARGRDAPKAGDAPKVGGSPKARSLGHDPETKQDVVAYDGRYGPVVRLGKPRGRRTKFASVPKGTALTDVTLDDALFLLSLPRFLKRSTPAVALKHGRYGFYVERDPATPVGRSTTRTVDGGLAGARALTIAGAEALLDAPPTFGAGRGARKPKRGARKPKRAARKPKRGRKRT